MARKMLVGVLMMTVSALFWIVGDLAATEKVVQLHIGGCHT